jgi:hypothetical protein
MKCEYCNNEEDLINIRPDTTWCGGCGTLTRNGKTKEIHFPQILKVLKNNVNRNQQGKKVK